MPRRSTRQSPAKPKYAPPQKTDSEESGEEDGGPVNGEVQEPEDEEMVTVDATTEEEELDGGEEGFVGFGAEDDDEAEEEDDAEGGDDAKDEDDAASGDEEDEDGDLDFTNADHTLDAEAGSSSVSDSDSEEDLEQEEDEDSEIDPPSETELELEKAVFGDRAGFQDGIRDFGIKGLELEDADEEDAQGGDDGLEGVADQDLFMVDTGDGGGAKAMISSANGEDAFADEVEGDKPAWEDSDDERIMVSLATGPRLRKLRRAEGEDVVNGMEYARRLRVQFERLNPPPAWAQGATHKTKRRRLSGSSEDSDSSSSDDESLSTQPLAKLLRDSSALSRWQTPSQPLKKRKLAPEKVSISRLKDIAGEQPSSISSLAFHPTHPLLLSTGQSKTLYLHHLHPYPPNPNPLLTSLHIKRTPLHTTRFHPLPSDPRIFLSSRTRHFHVWNVLTGSIQRIKRLQGFEDIQGTMEHMSLSPSEGKYIALRGHVSKDAGVINILSSETFQHIVTARVESKIAAFAWWGNGEGLSIVGTAGEVYEWDVRLQRTVAVWRDEGGLGTTTIALGGSSGRKDFLGGDRWVAIGSHSGIVNVYDRRAWLQHVHTQSQASSTTHSKSKDDLGTPRLEIPSHPAPLRRITNLVTSISQLAFSPDGQILLLASGMKRDALRLVHLPSATVFQNWPTQTTPLGRVTSVAWARGQILEGGDDGKSAGGDDVLAVLAVGNERGKIRVWEIRC